MRLITDLRAYQTRNLQRLVLAIGNFDGFHLGHQKILAYVVKQARKNHALSAVLTFRNHPQVVLHPQKKKLLLFSFDQKLAFLQKAGVDICLAPFFTRVFSKMSREVFVEKILAKQLRVLEVCMGVDARFGYRRRGTTSLMENLARKYGFLFKRMKPVLIGKRPVSSSWIRELLVKGEIEKVNRCLGRPFSIWGDIVRGKGHGIHLGFPTANLESYANIQIPLGVYVASARFLRRKMSFATASDDSIRFFKEVSPWIPGVMNFGKRPTYPSSETPQPVLETHLFDFKKRVYGKTMEVALHKFIRPEKRFADEGVLKKQIGKDVEVARKWHRKRPR